LRRMEARQKGLTSPIGVDLNGAPPMTICAREVSQNDPGPGCARTPEWKLYTRES
jgi:hypothetical protein